MSERFDSREESDEAPAGVESPETLADREREGEKRVI